MKKSLRTTFVIGRNSAARRLGVAAALGLVLMPAGTFGASKKESKESAENFLWTDPLGALTRSSTPLNLVETLLKAGAESTVAAYYDTLVADGNAETANRVRCLIEMYAGNDAGARQALELLTTRDNWASSRANYLNGLLSLRNGFAETPSDHFVLRVRSDDVFLAEYALPALESAHAKFAELLLSSPTAPTTVEIYPTLDGFAFASTQAPEAVERWGAAGVLKFGRLMLLSPQATPAGYRWLDALVRDYARGLVNRLSGGRCPPWLEEGAAEYLMLVWRHPGGFQRAPGDEALLAAAVVSSSGAERGLIPFSLMASSAAFPPDPAAVSLARAEASDAVNFIVEEYGLEKFLALLAAFRSPDRAAAFSSALGLGEGDLEAAWRESLVDRAWTPALGAIRPGVSLKPVDELSWVGDGAAEAVRQGDRFSRQGRTAAAILQYKKALEAEPNNGVVLTRLARAQSLAGQTAAAEALLRRAMEKNPSYAASFILLGDIYFDDGRYEEAQSALQGALEINPFHPKIHEILGLIAVDVGNFVEARRLLSRSLRFDPENEAVRNAIRRMPKPR